VKLPRPETEGVVSVEEALSKRRSIREYSDQALSLQEVGQILWAAQGVTSPRGFRTAPSAGGKYPIVLYLVASHVRGLSRGIYAYDPEAHVLRLLTRGDWSRSIYDAAREQLPVLRGAVNLVITAAYQRTKAKYAHSWEQYVHIEVGCVVQNVYLQAEALGLGTVVIGAFSPDKVKELLGTDLAPLAIMPIGKR
jgi:SagB-type dehydrogenase family enzyme